MERESAKSHSQSSKNEINEKLIMEELEIGSEIILKVVEANEECNGCFFNDLASYIYEDPCKRIKCGASQRKDKKNVIFVRVED